MDVRIQNFSEAIKSFSSLLAIDTKQFSEKLEPQLIDAIENGKAQKFEYTIELCWKAIKHVLTEQEGIDAASPKKVIKSWYLAGNLTEDEYILFIQAIDHRNKLSHVYNAEEFLQITKYFRAYATLMEKIPNLLTKQNIF